MVSIFHKHCCHKSQSIKKNLFSWKHLSFEREFNNQLNNLIIAIKLPKRQTKDSRYSEAATESKISEKNLWKSSLTVLLKKSSVLLKKEFSLRHFARTLPIDSVVKITD